MNKYPGAAFDALSGATRRRPPVALRQCAIGQLLPLISATGGDVVGAYANVLDMSMKRGPNKCSAERLDHITKARLCRDRRARVRQPFG